jgi:hypothetical protein
VQLLLLKPLHVPHLLLCVQRLIPCVHLHAAWPELLLQDRQPCGSDSCRC